MLEARRKLIKKFYGIYKRKVDMKFTKLRCVARIFTIVGLCGCWGQVAMSSELNIYSHRQPFLIQPFLDEFTKATGIKTNVLYSPKGLAQRLRAEGRNSPADVILTVDIGRLAVYQDRDLLASIESEKLYTNVPEHLRSNDSTWFGLSKRARIIVTAKERVNAGEITRFEQLADPRWRGKLCSRPGSHVYNRALMASMIAHYGEKEAENWAKGLVANLARRPQGNDRAQVKAIFEGVCDISIINNYYFGKLKHSDKQEQRQWADAISLVYPNQSKEDRGAHVNISGGGIAIHSKNKSNGIRLLEFLSEPIAQNLYGEINYEYPVNPNVPVSDGLATWGEFKEDQLPILTIAELSRKAQIIIDKVGW